MFSVKMICTRILDFRGEPLEDDLLLSLSVFGLSRAAIPRVFWAPIKDQQKLSFDQFHTHEQENVSLQELRIGVLPYIFTNVKVQHLFNFKKEAWIENNF